MAILFTFALGTSAGNLAAEGLGLGYLSTGLVFAAIIGIVALAYYARRINGILAFWLAYILTRPMGASAMCEREPELRAGAANAWAALYAEAAHEAADDQRPAVDEDEEYNLER